MTWAILDMFSGIGAFTLGLERAGMKPAAFVEIDSYCRDVLARHWPGVPIHHDVRTAEFPAVDVICGGFPCQDVSRAGKRAGVTGERSGLYRELVRAIRLVRPKRAILENVAALLDDGMGTVLGDLAEGGACVEWDCVPANALGACHERDRVWIIAHADSDGWWPGSSGQTAIARNESGRNADTQGVAFLTDADSVRCGAGLGAAKPGRKTPRRRKLSGVAASGGAADTAGDGCGQGRSWRPPDSFARVRDETRRNAADPYGARLAFRFGFGRDAFGEFEASERSRGADVGQSIWPDESRISRMDDETADRLDQEKIDGTVLSSVFETVGSQKVQRSAGSNGQVSETPALQQDLHGSLHAQREAVEIGLSETGCPSAQGKLRELREFSQSGGSPSGSRLDERSPEQSPDAMCILPHDPSSSGRGDFSETSASTVSVLRTIVIPTGSVFDASDAGEARHSIWPDVPALLTGSDEIPDWMDRTKATGNTLDPLIPELIGRAILEQANER